MTNILIPMAGEGSRFIKAGYTFPKPLIDVDGEPMIKRVIDNIKIPNASYTFIVRRDHVEQYNIDELLKSYCPSCNITIVNGITQGAACTALLAEEYISNGETLVIANSDQLVEADWENFQLVRYLYSENTAGIIFTFNSSHPKWSFVKVKDMCITEVAEKKPISNIATCGIYEFKTGRLFVEAAKRMIKKNITTNGEFYIAPVYNEIIEARWDIHPFYVSKMISLGTPEDLENYLDRL